MEEGALVGSKLSMTWECQGMLKKQMLKCDVKTEVLMEAPKLVPLRMELGGTYIVRS